MANRHRRSLLRIALECAMAIRYIEMGKYDLYPDHLL